MKTRRSGTKTKPGSPLSTTGWRTPATAVAMVADRRSTVPVLREAGNNPQLWHYRTRSGPRASTCSSTQGAGWCALRWCSKIRTTLPSATLPGMSFRGIVWSVVKIWGFSGRTLNYHHTCVRDESCGSNVRMVRKIGLRLRHLLAAQMAVSLSSVKMSGQVGPQSWSSGRQDAMVLAAVWKGTIGISQPAPRSFRSTPVPAAVRKRTIGISTSLERLTTHPLKVENVRLLLRTQPAVAHGFARIAPDSDELGRAPDSACSERNHRQMSLCAVAQAAQFFFQGA